METWTEINREFEDLREILRISGDEEVKEIEDEAKRLEQKIESLELRLVLQGKDDKRDAIFTIHPGAGGTESCDWAAMLFRMYMRWLESKNFKVRVLNYEPGDVAGIKDATIEVRGEYAYGYLKAESGVHRLVRISPFDASHRRHTSFVSCFAYPLIDEDVKIEINEKDIRIDTFRASGPGGQYVNTASTAVRITHIPTGIVVTCQNERSQFQNKETAMKVLRSRLYQRAKEEERKRIEKLSEEKKEIGWGREIRSYVFHPYKLVKDHRTDYERTDIEKVMDGDIDPFIRAYLLSKKGNSRL